jgi:hypothetical protein
LKRSVRALRRHLPRPHTTRHAADRCVKSGAVGLRSPLTAVSDKNCSACAADDAASVAHRRMGDSGGGGITISTPVFAVFICVFSCAILCPLYAWFRGGRREALSSAARRKQETQEEAETDAETGDCGGGRAQERATSRMTKSTTDQQISKLKQVPGPSAHFGLEFLTSPRAQRAQQHGSRPENHKLISSTFLHCVPPSHPPGDRRHQRLD